MLSIVNCAPPAMYALLAGLLLALPACKTGKPGTDAAKRAPATSEYRLDPAATRRQFALPPTQVMVFGLEHLDTAPPAFQVAWLEPVLCRLRAYKPDVILTEAMSGEQIMGLEAYAAYHGDAGKYGGPTLQMAKTAQADLKLTAAQALVQANALSSQPNLTEGQRRQLAHLFVAAAEPFSAAVQWVRLAPAERTATDGIAPKLVTQLNAFAKARSEISSIGVRLAADLGLERVYGAGDHLSDVALPDNAAMNAAIVAEPGMVDSFNHRTPAFQSIPEDTMKLRTAAQVLPVMRWRNSSRFAELDAEAQWLAMLRSDKMGRVGRQRVAAWEAQNLRMAVAIREATAPIAGGRALLIVGAAHKSFIEAYLRTFTDVEVVSVPVMLDAKPADCSE
ncbi:DUF5694 domain-containing protein [Hymenobacter terrestris]|uniref:TraB/GumN family protein n=1 Tax=Hymenobacter terrestris TaxID=2748310 RepID=A0ABX2Q5G4_9BACT|nr:DUF5694 domain-containing protein [Hymenobacter terrestris]NVO85500.1 hypothetical protein [Hymenobacter terrestris]